MTTVGGADERYVRGWPRRERVWTRSQVCRGGLVGGLNGDGRLSRQAMGNRRSTRTSGSPQQTRSGIVLCATSAGALN